MNPQDPRHERLCAYVFGELEGEARAAFEAELAASPELQAERANLEATIGLVRSALPADRLPASVHADLERAARARGPRRGLRFLPGGRMTRLAAAAVVLVVGVSAAALLLKQEGGPQAPSFRAEGSVAKLEADARPDSSEMPELRGLGYVAGSELQAVRGAKNGNPTEPVLDESLMALAAMGYGGGYGATASAPPASAAVPVTRASGRAQEQLLDLGYVDRSRDLGANLAPARERVRTETVVTRVDPMGPGSPGPADPAPVAPGEVVGGVNFYTEPFLSEGVVDQVLDELGYSGPVVGKRFSLRQPVLTEEQIRGVADDLVIRCGLQPGETPQQMFFRQWGDNPFVFTQTDPLSTFSVDVDTASYVLTRRHLVSHELPDPARIRTEEFVNYFRADQPAPAAGETFAIGLEAAPGLFSGEPDVELLRVTLRGRDVHPFDRQPLALTFVVDVSGSMKENGSLAGESRLDLVKHSLELLIHQLSGTDSLALVTFNTQAVVVAPPTPAGARGVIEDALAQLVANGGTNVESGLTEGFRLAAEHLVPDAVNRVVFLSDGVGNIGETDQAKILELVASQRERGVYLNSIGLGFENSDSDFLEQLADRGDGVCSYVDSRAEAEKAFVNDFTKTLQPIARDVKIQVEFDPAKVRRYRQIGYENRALAHADFKNDAVDAGEVNAGHQVSALYEIERYPGSQGTLATVRVRYKGQHAVDAGDESAEGKRWAETAVEIERTFGTSAIAPSFQAATPGFRRSVLVAQFAEVLRQSVHARGDSRERLLRASEALAPTLDEPEFVEFVELLKLAEPLLAERDAQATPEVLEKIDVLSRLNYERSQRELVEKDEDPDRLAREAEAIQQAEADLRAAILRSYQRR